MTKIQLKLKKRLAFYLLAGLFIFPSTLFAEMVVHVIDVGHGSAVHVEVDYQHYLFDVGPKASLPKIMRHLSNNFVTRLEAVFLTHTHEDHMGSLLPLIKQIKTGRVFWNGEFPLDESLVEDLDAAEKISEMTTMKPGQNIQLGRNLILRALKQNLETDDLNDNSLVFGLTFGKNKFLITGDIGVERQKELAEIEKRWLKKTNWFLWPHHGDKLDENFISSMKNPNFCIVSVGENPYNLPHSSLIPTAKKHCGVLLKTDQTGDLGFLVRGKIYLITNQNK